MEVVALCVTVLLAVIGFIVNDQAARRAKRRDIRSQYLVSAYRRIEAASNRPMDLAAARDLEAALADVQLLGTAEQVTATHVFADEFAQTGGADTGPILNELRDQLRADLDLGPLPERRTHLRVMLGTQRADIEWSDNARVSSEAIVAQSRAMHAPSEQRETAEAGTSPEVETATQTATETWNAVQDALENQLISGGVPAGELPFEERLRIGVEEGLVSERTARGIAGLRVMYDLLVHDVFDPTLSAARAREFSVLARAIRGLFDAGLAGPLSR